MNKQNQEEDLCKSFPQVLVENNEQDQWAHTLSTLYNVNFRWTINNFSLRCEEVGQYLKSPIFFSNANDAIKWRLLLYPNGKNDESKDYLSIYLYLVSEQCIKSKIIGKFNFFILNAEFNKINKTNLTKASHFEESSRLWGCLRFFKRSEFLDEANGYLSEDELKIVCELSFVSDSVDISSQKSTRLFKVPESKIIHDLANLFESTEFSDVKLIVDSYEFPAHKAILAARSDVFAAMFKHDMEERSSGAITITDVNHDIIHEMLRFIYTEESLKLKELANHLMAAADKYGLKKLKMMSEEALFDKLSIETAVETLVLADLHSAEQLKEQTVNFIATHAREIIKTNGWQNIKNSNTHSTLIAEIFEAFFTQPEGTCINITKKHQN